MQPATTTTAISGGGGGGGGGNPSTTTTSVQPATTTTVQPTTTTTVFAECTNDIDCDDNLFCNGVERCAEGICIAGDDPCQTGQTCKEAQKRCVTIKRKTGRIISSTIKQPSYSEKKSRWLLIRIAEDTDFNQTKSRIILKGPDETAAGVTIDSFKKALKLNTGFGGFILLPAVIHKSAATGQWSVELTTEIEGSNPYEEIISADFQIKRN